MIHPKRNNLSLQLSRLKNKQTKTAPNAKRVGNLLTFEEALLYLWKLLAYHPGPQKADGVPDGDKHRFADFGRDPRKLSLTRYQQILRKLLGSIVFANDAPHGGTVISELTEFLARFEELRRQISTKNANLKQVRWALVNRFVVPWLALRIAFFVHGKPEWVMGGKGRWFLPYEGAKLRSSFMKVLNYYVRKAGETENKLCERIVGADSRAANSLFSNLQHYKQHVNTASDQTITSIVKATQTGDDLCFRLILARAIDRMAQDGIAEFGRAAMIRLVRFFVLCLNHFRELLDSLPPECRGDKASIWRSLESRTLTGRTAVEEERFHVLIDRFGCELAEKINEELAHAASSGKLSSIPQMAKDFTEGTFPELELTVLPLTIHEAIRARNFRSAVEASRTFFGKTGDRAQAAQVAQFFGHLGVNHYTPGHAGAPWRLTDSEAAEFNNEAKRLFLLAVSGTKGTKQMKIRLMLLEFLIVPHRPKDNKDGQLARRLFCTLEKHFKRIGLEGSGAYLHGCLLWLEGKQREALEAFLKAVKRGKESCEGVHWIELLRSATVLAEMIPQRRHSIYLRNLAQIEGVFSCDSTPRTNLVLNELRYGEFKHGLIQSFYKFPVTLSRKR